MRIQLGNADQGITFNGIPTHASDIFTTRGNMKATITGASAGQKLVLLNDLHFLRYMGLAQSQNVAVNFGYTGVEGVLAHNPPHADVAHNQAQLICYRNPRQGFVDVDSAEYITLEFTGPAGTTFLANLG
jgi:hypothetical protein